MSPRRPARYRVLSGKYRNRCLRNAGFFGDLGDVVASYPAR